MASFLNFFKSLKNIEKILLILFLTYFIGLIAHLFSDRTHYLWDFQVCYSAAKSYLLHLNLYNTKELYAAHTNVAELPYMYPPMATYYFLPFAFLKIELATAIYLCIKIAALIGLYYAWSKIYFEKKYVVVFLYYSLLAFNAAIHKDLITGNFSIFEQLAIWSAIYFFLKDKLWIFSLLIIFISTLKLVPIVFLVFVLFSPSKNKIKIFLLSSAIFFFYLMLNYILEPRLTVNYVNSFFSNSVPKLTVGGISNACSLLFFRSLTDLFYSNAPTYIFILIYLVFVSVVSFFTWVKLKRIIKDKSPEARLLLTFALCLGIIIILPRFADYSYILAILPVFYLAVKTYKKTGVILLLILVCLSASNVSIPIFKDILELLWNYYTFIISFIVWLLYLREVDILKQNSLLPR